MGALVVLLNWSLGCLDVVDDIAPRGDGELVNESPEEARNGEGEQGPGKTLDGGDAGALVGVWLPLKREGSDGVAALETMAEGRRLDDAGARTVPHSERELDRQVEHQWSAPVKQTPEQAGDGAEEQETHGVLVLLGRPIRRVASIFVDLLRDEAELDDVKHSPKGEEEEVD